MSCQGPALAMPEKLRRARRGELSLQLTVSDLVSVSGLVSAAVNTVQNGWAYSELPLERPDCQRSGSALSADVRADLAHQILVQVYAATLIANRDAAALLAGEGAHRFLTSKTQRNRRDQSWKAS